MSTFTACAPDYEYFGASSNLLEVESFFNKRLRGFLVVDQHTAKVAKVFVRTDSDDLFLAHV